MASYDKCIKFESEKPEGVIRLVEANGFYRAYNRSAYAFHQVIAQHKVTKKFVKNINQEIVYVGFPVDKLLERIGNRSHKKTELGYDVELLSGELPNETTCMPSRPECGSNGHRRSSTVLSGCCRITTVSAYERFWSQRVGCQELGGSRMMVCAFIRMCLIGNLVN